MRRCGARGREPTPAIPSMWSESRDLHLAVIPSGRSEHPVIPSERSESRDLHLGFSQRAQRAQRTASGRSAPNVISRGARGDRGGTTRGERPRGRDRRPRALLLSIHDVKVLLGSGGEISPPRSAPPRAEAGLGFPWRTAPRLRVKSLAGQSRNAERPRHAEASRGRSQFHIPASPHPPNSASSSRSSVSVVIEGRYSVLQSTIGRTTPG